ncbi:MULTISPECIES: DUF2087 domain-containing protein [unclassified Streptomyces]|uniref:DUF2087 domain-containing protein n=1 Tax=unclassified Streptomyces TaxID=2593676 RepID=UPI002E821634|nr:DUF2087 domain-containing protein [Streptomyces sp. NBC_00589]WTI39107.1 DUF2087 domain-containing protein [Streptomyces sp. NBC_00775]WUB27214.1 DUF2087 domain-containing protein [Streptomyces sp. NBC_00589]
MPTDQATDEATDPTTGVTGLAGVAGVIGLFAEETRARAFAAVALGADTPAKVMEKAGLSPKDAAVALRRLQEQGVITRDDGGLGVAYGRFRELARSARAVPLAESYGSGDEQSETVLRTFVRDGRLVRLPAQWERKLVVLRHIAERTFEPGVEYPERTVNEKLRAWCEDAPVDHVTLRRYLVDLHHLHRQNGLYWRPATA